MRPRRKAIVVVLGVVILIGGFFTWQFCTLQATKQRVWDALARKDYATAVDEFEKALAKDIADPDLELGAGMAEIYLHARPEDDQVIEGYRRVPKQARDHFVKALEKSGSDREMVIKRIEKIYTDAEPKLFDLTLAEAKEHPDLDIQITGSGTGTAVHYRISMRQSKYFMICPVGTVFLPRERNIYKRRVGKDEYQSVVVITYQRIWIGFSNRNVEGALATYCVNPGAQPPLEGLSFGNALESSSLGSSDVFRAIRTIALLEMEGKKAEEFKQAAINVVLGDTQAAWEERLLENYLEEVKRQLAAEDQDISVLSELQIRDKIRQSEKYRQDCQLTHERVLEILHRAGDAAERYGVSQSLWDSAISNWNKARHK